MKTIKLIVKGRVQRVGYRNAVSQIADELNISGQIQNLEDKTAEIIVQGRKENIKKFCKKIKIQEWPIQVKGISVQEIGEEKIYEDFNIIRGDMQKEMAERTDVAALYLQKLDQDNAKEKTLAAVRNEMSKEVTLEKFQKRTEEQLNETAREKTLQKFDTNTEKEFKDLDVKYGSVSQKLDRIADSMEKLTTALLEIAQKR